MVNSYSKDDVIGMAESMEGHSDWNISQGTSKPDSLSFAETWAKLVDENKQKNIELEHISHNARLDFLFPETAERNEPFPADADISLFRVRG